MNGFDDKNIKLHLADYKLRCLGVEECGSWSGTGYPHILPSEGTHLNILETIRAPFLKYLSSQPFSLDDGFAHLNSSQALAFNFFFPLIPSGISGLDWAQSDRLEKLFGFEFQKVTEVAFEKVHDSKEKTHLDWWARAEDGKQVFCEVKYTENRFGRASNAKVNYKKRLEEVYRPGLKGIVRESWINDPELFKANYQILRNLWHLQLDGGPEKNKVIFLLPGSAPTCAEITAFVEEAVTPAAKASILVAPLEDCALRLKDEPTIDFEEKRHWRLFLNKYCPWANTSGSSPQS